MGYRHGGDEVYLNRYGRIRKLKGVLRSRDRWRGFVIGLLKANLDLLTDHSVRLYAQHLAAAVQQEDERLARGHGPIDRDELVIRRPRKARHRRDTAIP